MKKKNRFVTAIDLCLIFLYGMGIFGSDAGAAGKLSLQGFLAQVDGEHKGIRAAEQISEGALERSGESLLVYRPTLFSTVSYTEDKSPTAGSFVERSKQITKDYQVGISQGTNFGLQAKLYYDLMRTDVYGATNPSYFPEGGNYWSGKPYLELSQSLWRNGFGAEVRSQVELQKSAAEATGHAQGFRAKLLRVDAERAYWQLVATRETVRVDQENLDRAVRMRNYQSRRAKLDLTDRSDLLQAEAAFQVRTLELKAALDDAKAAARAFNLARGIVSDSVSEDLDSIETQALLKTRAPERVEMREDVKAAEAESHVAAASAKIGIEKQSPSFEIFSNINLSGRNSQFNPAFENSFGSRNSTATVGVRFSTPLDFGLLAKNRAGYRREVDAANWNFERKVLEQDNEWKDLVARLEDSKTRLSLALRIEEAQREKMNHERTRQEKGRTTTYQVLVFEQEFAQSQVMRIRAELEVLGTLAQLKTFGAKP